MEWMSEWVNEWMNEWMKVEKSYQIATQELGVNCKRCSTCVVKIWADSAWIRFKNFDLRIECGYMVKVKNMTLGSFHTILPCIKQTHSFHTYIRPSFWVYNSLNTYYIELLVFFIWYFFYQSSKLFCGMSKNTMWST